MTPILAQEIPDINTVWLVVISLITTGSSMATIGLWWQGRRRQEVQVTGDRISVELTEDPVTRTDFHKHLDASRHELDKVWTTMRDENTAIRHEITEAVQHSQEMLMDKLEKNRRELSDKLDHMPGRIIADLGNARGLLE
jgi:predicted DNA-binding protein (MmcQ/YjbR family)